jgi:DMSO/TMAO reductase YedYZ heme-binding membrane subunit
MRKTPVLLPLILLLLISPVLALPNYNTDVTGQSCEMAHYLDYTYSFDHPNSIELGKSYSLKITFSIVSSQVTRNPLSVEAQITPNGFEVDSKTVVLQGGKATVTITPTKENPSLSIKTMLTLSGNTGIHPGYRAVYSDNVLLSDFKLASSTAPKNQTANTSTKTDDSTTTKTSTTQGNTTTTTISVQRNQPSVVPWYLVRIMGLAAFALLALSVIVMLLKKLGIGFLAKHHCDISYFALIFAFLHLINQLWDKYAWALPTSSLFFFHFSTLTKTMISLGVIAFYLMVVVVFTSSPHVIRIIKHKNWKPIHLMSYFMFGFVLVHSILLGTDLKLKNLTNLSSLFGFMAFWILNLIILVLAILVLKRRLKK